MLLQNLLLHNYLPNSQYVSIESNRKIALDPSYKSCLRFRLIRTFANNSTRRALHGESDFFSYRRKGSLQL